MSDENEMSEFKKTLLHAYEHEGDHLAGCRIT